MSLTDEQKQARKNKLFASDIARLMTGGAFRLGLEKLEQIPDSGDALEDVEEVKVGHELEPKILDAYQEEFQPNALIRSPNTMLHPTEQWLGAHLDGIAFEENRIVITESKSVGWYNRSDWGDGGDDVPNKVLWQVQAQMAVARVEGKRINLARIPVCFLDTENFLRLLLKKLPNITMFEVQYDADLEEALIERGRKFFQECIQQRHIPLPETIDDVKLLYQKDSGVVVEATYEVMQALSRLVDLKEMEKKLKAAKAREEFTIKTFMQEADRKSVV